MRYPSDCKTGTRIPYPHKDGDYFGWELVEFKCPTCKHRWFEYNDSPENPEVCPLCGCGLREEAYCRNCGKPLIKSDLPDYVWQCKYCDEDFYEFEVVYKNEKEN